MKPLENPTWQYFDYSWKINRIWATEKCYFQINVSERLSVHGTSKLFQVCKKLETSLFAAEEDSYIIITLRT